VQLSVVIFAWLSVVIFSRLSIVVSVQPSVVISALGVGVVPVFLVFFGGGAACRKMSGKGDCSIIKARVRTSALSTELPFSTLLVTIIIIRRDHGRREHARGSSVDNAYRGVPASTLHSFHLTGVTDIMGAYQSASDELEPFEHFVFASEERLSQASRTAKFASEQHMLWVA
jgi:hypothetical protein